MSHHKLGRNERCWCGSGKKFKHCHLDREQQERISPWDGATKFRQAFKTETCSAPDAWRSECSQQISHSHTVPKSGSLRKIARNGHVYAFIPSIENFTKNDGLVVPELVGLKHASTFSGFCSKHDNAIFAPIEKQAFTYSQEQCFLLAYRSLAREVYTKKAADSLADLRRDADRGTSPEEQYQIQAFNLLHDLGLGAGVRDNDLYKSTYDAILQKGEFERVRSYVIELEQPPDVMCSASIFPEEDFEGNKLQDIADLQSTPDLLSITSFCDGDRGVVIFSWLPESDQACHQFIQTLDRITDSEVTNALLRFFFEHCENVLMKPDWWEKLPKKTRDAVIKRMVESVNPFQAKTEKILTDDGICFLRWNVVRRLCIGTKL